MGADLPQSLKKRGLPKIWLERGTFVERRVVGGRRKGDWGEGVGNCEKSVDS